MHHLVPSGGMAVALDDCDLPYTQFQSPAHPGTAPPSSSWGNLLVCTCNSFGGTHSPSLVFAHTCASCSHPLKACPSPLEQSWAVASPAALVPNLVSSQLPRHHVVRFAANPFWTGLSYLGPKLMGSAAVAVAVGGVGVGGVGFAFAFVQVNLLDLATSHNVAGAHQFFQLSNITLHTLN